MKYLKEAYVKFYIYIALWNPKVDPSFGSGLGARSDPRILGVPGWPWPRLAGAVLAAAARPGSGRGRPRVTEIKGLCMEM